MALRSGRGVDRHVVEFELRVEQEDHSGAIDTFARMRRLGSEYIPHELWYVHATICDRSGLLHSARESLNVYIDAAGRDGKHYRDALRLWVLVGDRDGAA